MAEDNTKKYADRPIVVIGGPGLARGPLEKKCLNCGNAFPIQVSTQMMISKARKENKDPIILCVLCFGTARQKGLLANGEAFGVREGMKKMGL